MSDVAEGIGGAIEGVLAGRAVEPRHGEAAGDGESESCSNCGSRVTATYCSECGQKRHVHRTITAIFHDLIHGVLHLDGKFWTTLPLLAFKPGKLTRRYIDGERAKFVSPMAMLLFSVFAMFAVFQIVGIGVPGDLSFGEEGRATLEEAEQTWADELEKRTQAIQQMPEGSAEREAAQEALDEAEKNVAELRGLRGLLGDGEADEADVDVQVQRSTGSELRDIPFIAKLADKWTENPSLMLYKLQANAYKFSWLLIPLSIPFVWLLFAWKRRFKAYDHAVFVTYSLSFMSLLFIVVSLIAVSPVDGFGGWAFTILATVAPLHLYKHIKYTYDLGRFSTLWRFFALLVFILIVIVLFLQTLLLLGAF